MNTMEIDMDWLQKRVLEEHNNIKSKQINILKYLFTSSEKIKQNKDEALKSLAKVEMIAEIFEKAVKDIPK